MNPFRIVATAEDEAHRLYRAYQTVLAARPLNLTVLWHAQRAYEQAEQRKRQARSRLDTWRRLRWSRLGPCLAPIEAGRRRLTWNAMRKALGDLGMSATGIDVWLRATERISRASRQAGDRWSFYLVSAIHQALRQPGDLQTELLRLPVEHLIRLVRTLSPWALTLSLVKHGEGFSRNSGFSTAPCVIHGN